MINQIVIQGRLVKDPELRTTQSGVLVATFTVAVERDFVPQGQERQTDFIECVAWKQTGEFVSKWFRKGNMIIVTGSLQSRKWQEKETGKNRVSWEVNANHCYFGEAKARDGQAQMDGRPQQEYRTSRRAPDVYADEPAGYSGGEPRYVPETAFQQELIADDDDIPF